jgi:hypothetical protein
MGGIYTSIFNRIMDSSVWSEEPHVVKTWLTLLFKKNEHQQIFGTAYNISRWAVLDEKDVIEALKVLSSPDTRRLEPQPHEGRRIQKIEGGWFIINGENYDKELAKIRNRISKANWAKENRAEQKLKKGNPLPGEDAFVKAQKAGAPAAVLDKLSEPVVRKQDPSILGDSETQDDQPSITSV